jgi:hypothetical protein
VAAAAMSIDVDNMGPLGIIRKVSRAEMAISAAATRLSLVAVFTQAIYIPHTLVGRVLR